MQYQRLLGVLLITAALCGACDSDTDFAAMEPIEPHATALDKGVVFFQPLFDQLLYLEPDAQGADFHELMRVDEQDVLLWMQAGPAADGTADGLLYLLTAPKNVRDLSRTEQLHVVGPEHEAVTYDVGAPFDSIAFGPDGRYAVLYFSRSDAEPIDDEGLSNGETGGLYNPNEIAIVQLDAAPSASNPAAASIDIDGGVVQQVVFLDNLAIGGSGRKLAAFFADNLLKLVDLERPAVAQAKIPLTNEPKLSPIVPTEIVTLPGDDTQPARLFVRATHTNDIYDLTLVEEDAEDFTATMNIFDGGPGPLDLEVIHDGTRDLVVTVSHISGGGQFTVIDAETADSFSILLDEPVDRILRRAGTEGIELVGYGHSSYELYFLQVEDLYQARGSNLEKLRLSFPMGPSQELSADRMVVQPADSFDIVVLDLITRDSTRLISHVEANLGDSQLFGDRIFFSPQDDWQLSSVDLTTGHPDSLYLDNAVDGLWLPRGSAYGVVLHDAPCGRVTIFDNAAPSRATSRVIDGLWLNGFLSETEVK